MMRKEQMVWIDVMGPEPCYVEALVDDDERKVYVGRETLGVMIDAIRTAGIFGDEDTEGIVEGLQQSPRRHGLVDVTEMGGGFDNWQPVEA